MEIPKNNLKLQSASTKEVKRNDSQRRVKGFCEMSISHKTKWKSFDTDTGSDLPMDER